MAALPRILAAPAIDVPPNFITMRIRETPSQNLTSVTEVARWQSDRS
jgi:hypothetical protein